MSIDPIYLGLFVLVACGSAFALGRLLHWADTAPRGPGAWERATTTRYEGMSPLDRPAGSGWIEPVPHLDVEGEVVEAIEVEFICDLSEGKSA